MATLSAAGAWLQESLLSSLTHFDADVVASLVSYCERAPPLDAKEYLTNIIGEENCSDIIAGYLQRRGTPGDLGVEGGIKDGMHVYVKPQASEIWSAGSKKIIKNSKAKVSESNVSSSVADAASGSELSGPSSKSKSGGGKTKRTGKGISLAEAAEGKMIMSRGAPCTCQATRHKLVNNCLSCGRIVCEQEGEGPCNFCGALVLLEGSTYAGLEGLNVPISDSEAAAQAFKDRLVEYGRTSSQRTTVIDDQSDYFQVDESTWLSEEEKRAILKRQEEVQLAEDARKKKVVVSFDLLGRKVVMASDTENDIHTNSSILDVSPLADRSNDLRIKPNPYILKNPVFLSLQQHKETGPQGKGPAGFGRRPSDVHRNGPFVKTGRVQHDDPFVSALGSINPEKTCEKSINDTWKTPNVKERASKFSNEDEECLMDCKVKETEAAVFDICEPQKGKRYSLSPSLLATKQAERSQILESSSAISILMPGMVLLKHWLSQNDQVEIVQKCRNLGIGSGGFYQPGYGSESKMHLQMMCLGMHWEPVTRSYEMKRSIDNASPPNIPHMFETIVDQCLSDAQHACQDEIGRKGNAKDMIPEMHPNVCIINFYERHGKLGLHQDRDESQISLKRGTPVVSFSIGDSAEFMYGVDRDVDKAATVILESGDVLIFGGPSRMIYHGVPSILLQTAPSWLIEKTSLRPGRMNLTFRQT